jgi:hypothetical protein
VRVQSDDMELNDSADTPTLKSNGFRLTIAHLLVFLLVTAVQFWLHSEDLAKG